MDAQTAARFGSTVRIHTDSSPEVLDLSVRIHTDNNTNPMQVPSAATQTTGHDPSSCSMAQFCMITRLVAWSVVRRRRDIGRRPS